MRFLAKLSVSILSFVCIILTLLRPSKDIFIALIPTTVALVIWVTSDYFSMKKRVKVCSSIFLFLGFVLILTCFVFYELTDSILPSPTDSSHYYIHFDNKVALLGGEQVSYTCFLVGAVIMFAIIFFFDFLLYWFLKDKDDNQSFHQLAQAVIPTP